MASGLLAGRSSGIGNQLHGPYFRLKCSVFGGVRLWNGMHFRGVVVSGGGWLRSLLCRDRDRHHLVDPCLSSGFRRQRQRSQIARWRSSLYLKVAHAGDLGKRNFQFRRAWAGLILAWRSSIENPVRCTYFLSSSSGGCSSPAKGAKQISKRSATGACHHPLPSPFTSPASQHQQRSKTRSVKMPKRPDQENHAQK